MVYGQSTPLADHHQHLFSPAVTKLSTALNPITASDVVSLLDAAGIERAVVLSAAYMFGSPNRAVENEYVKVKAENDWTSQQVGRFPNRLIGFCSFNPLREYALEELARCAKDPRLRAGLKLHFEIGLSTRRKSHSIVRDNSNKWRIPSFSKG